MTSETIAAELAQLVTAAAADLLLQADGPTVRRPRPGSWSKREILGHLIDSAANNHQRFVRAQHVDELVYAGYDQEAWVACQRYAERDWHELVALWEVYNHHLVHVLRVMPSDVFDTPCRADGCGADQTVPLSSVAEGYLSHMRHHLAQLTP